MNEAQHALLSDWEAADRQWGGKDWTAEERQECAEYLQQNPDFQPDSIVLSKFGSVNAVISRYKGLLGRLESLGVLTPQEIQKRAQIAILGQISLGSILREGKALKAMIDQRT